MTLKGKEVILKEKKSKKTTKNAKKESLTRDDIVAGQEAFIVDIEDRDVVKDTLVQVAIRENLQILQEKHTKMWFFQRRKRKN